MEKKTKVVKYAEVKAILAQVETEDYDMPMLIEFIDGEIAALERKAAKAKETAAAKKAERDELCEVVLSVLTAEPQTREQITEQVEGDEISVAKVGARLNKLVAQGLAEKTEVASVSASGKKSTKMAYSLALVEAAPSDEE